MSANSSFSTFATSTLRNYRKTLIENILGQQALWFQLKERGFIETQPGGRSLVVPLLYGSNDTVKSYSGYDLLDVTPQTGISAAEFDWKYIAASVSISGQEEAENAGDRTRVFNLLDAKIRQAEISLKEAMNAQLFAAGTANGGKDITGLLAAVEDGSSWSTYGGIDGSVAGNAFWRNQFIDFDGAYTSMVTADGPSYGLISGLRDLFTKCVRGNSKPSLIVTSSAVYNAYEKLVEGDKQRVTSNKLADAGFINMEFKGVPMIFDEDCGSDDLYMLNADFLKLMVHKGRNFMNTPFVKPHNQDAKVSQILWAGNLVTNKRDQHGRLIDVV